MNKLFNFICADENVERASWIVNSFPVIKIVIMVLLALLAIAMIILVLMQKSEQNGISAISGQTDTFYNRNKRGTLQGKIKNLTIIVAISIMVLVIAFIVLNGIYSGYVK